jgi:two-component system CheB/CheR fusion protein
MPVAEVKDGMRIERDHIYVIPPNRNLRLSRGVLQTLSAHRSPAAPAIDFFFNSLAEDKRDQAIGVVLSGLPRTGRGACR